MSERIYKKRKHWESEQMKESSSSTSASTNQQSIIGLSEEERIAESERENQAIVSAFLDNQDNQSVIQHNSNIDGSDASWSQSFSNHSINQALQQAFHTSTGGRSYDIQSYDNSSNQFQFSSNQSVIQNDLGVDSTYPTSPRSFSGSPLFGQSSNQSLSHWLNNGQSNNNQPSPTMSSPALPSLNLNNPYYSWNPSQSSSSQSSPPSNDGPSSVTTEQNQTSMSNNLSSQHPHSQPLVRRRLQPSQARSQAPYSAQMAVQALGPSHIDQSMNPTSNLQNSLNTNTRPSVNPNLPSFVQSMYGLSPQSSPPAMQSPSIISVSSMSSNNSANLLNNQSVSSRSGTGSSGQLPTLWSQSSQSSNLQLQRFQSHPDDSHFKFTEHEILAERYEVLRVLGRGTFAQALLCRDLFADHLAAYEDDHPPQNEQMGQQAKQPRRAVQVAVKVVRNVERYRIAAQREIQVLKHLTQRRLACVPDSQSARGAEGCIPFLGSFILPAGHPCMVFPVLNQSLYDFLRFHQFRPLMAAHVRHIAFQLLVTCQYLHDECGIVHADIKPENVLFVDSSCASVKIADVDVEVPYNTAVRLIDFGTAVFINQRSEMPAVVASRAYRSIEVVLGTGWSTGVDMWAIGCLLMEIYTGHRLFDIGHGTDADHLNAMTAILGPIPAHVKNKPRVYAPQNEQSSLTLNPPFPPEFRLIPLHERIVPGDWYFYDLVSRLLAYDTSERVTAQQALQHPYFTQAPDYSM